MANFVVIEKDSLNKAAVNAERITLTEASIVHTKMKRDDVAEFVRDGNNLLLKLKSGEVVVIENFFVVHEDIASDLVFEEDGCVLYWFDGVSGFQNIPGLEVLLPEAGSKLGALLPWLAGAAVIGGVAAAVNNNDKKESTPSGTNTVQVKKDGTITGKTENIPDGTKVIITVTGKDKDGKLVRKEVEATVKADGSYEAKVPADLADGDLTVDSKVQDQKGNTVKAEDKLGKTDHDNNPGTPDQGGLDLEDGSITVKVDNKGNITGTTADIEPGSEVKLTITGKDKDGQALADTTVKATVNPDGSYTAQVPPNFADGDLTVKAETADRNGKPVNAEDKLGAGKADDPGTPGNESEGLDRVDGKITVDITDKGAITGGTTDVAPNTDVVLTITGKNAAGGDVTVSKTVKTDGSGSYSSALTPADGIAEGSAVTVVASTTDRNGRAVPPATDAVAGKTDHDNNPGTPDQGGIDLVAGAITVDITDQGAITGGTTDVAPNTDVVLTITGKNAAGGDVTVTKTVKTDGSGNYSSALTPADGIADGSAVTVVASTTDRNGKAVPPATDAVAGKTDHDNNPGTPDQGGIDLVAGAITVDITDQGGITGGTTDVAPNTDVVLTITGKNAAGGDVTVTKTVKTDGSGNYTSALTPADGIADGSAVTVVASTTDRNGQGVGPATDSIAAQGDNDNDPSTPEDTGLDLVAGAITVDIVETGAITGTTTDVAPGTDVVLTITGTDANGNPVTVSKTVKTDGSGNYTSALTPADGIAEGSAVTVVANTTDRNGQGVGPATDSIAAQGDNDNDPSTPEDTGLDLVAGAITVDIVETGAITGTTTDVAPGTDVVLTITGTDANGNPVTVSKTVKTDGSGNYTSALTPADGIAEGSAVTVVASTTDRNGRAVPPATDAVAGKTDHDNNPGTPDQGGIDLVAGAITVDITDQGAITGGTTDVAPNTDVVLTIAGKNAAGVDVEITRTVKAGADGKYTYQLVAGDGIAEGSAVEVEANTTDRNGKAVTPAQDSIDGRVIDDPATPADESVPGGLDLVAGAITVDIVETGAITGTTTDVAPGTDVVLTITGTDANGNPVTVSKTVTTDASGNYSSAVTAADGIVDGSAVTVVANTTDRNGQAVPSATDSIAAQGDNDNDPSTPEDTGLDLVAGAITVDIVETGAITGTTTDVAPGTDVVLTITGTDANGNPVTVSKTVTTDASGHYNSALTPADGIVDGSSVTVVANTTDRNGQGVGPATDSIAAQGDNDKDPRTPEDTGLDLVTGAITVDIVETGVITGTTTDVAPGTDVVLTITGKDANGNPVTVSKTVQTDASGHYNSALTPADGIVDGSSVTVVANTTDRNGQGVGPATDSIAAQGDNDKDPRTPEDTGLDLVTGAITVDIVETGVITGTTTDVAPGTDVVLTITGKDANGNPVTVSKTVQTDASGHYNSALTPADGIVDGSAVTVVANTTDRNGQGVGPATDSIAAQGDNDKDPRTPEDTGLDLVTGAITVDIVETGVITGTTTDVAPGTDVVLTITGTDANGNPVTVSKTVTTDASGNYSSAVTAADGIAEGSAVEVEANTTDRNGKAVTPAQDSIDGRVIDDPATPADESVPGGLDLVAGKITVEIAESGEIKGTTKDVAPNTDVVLTITGKNAAGGDVTVTKTVKTDGSGNYSSALTPADGIADGSAVTVVASTTDRNGKPVVPATDAVAGKADHDSDPGTPDQGGIDLVAGAITVDITDKGAITGGTTDVAPNTDVVLTITGKNAAGGDVTVTKTVKTDGSGSYTSALTPADGIADGSAVTVVASTTDRNGKAVPPATDAVAGKADHDNNPGTPDQGGIDLVAGAITVDITDKGIITGGTTDVAPNTDVVLTISGKNAAGIDVTVTKTVKTDGSGNYSSALTPADGIVDGSAVTVVANTTDRNGQAVPSATDSIAAQGDNDNDPSTPEDTGLDLVAGAITVDIVETGAITGTTTDVAPGTDVVLTITGTDANGNPVTVSKTVTTDASGNYSSAVTAADGIAEGSAVEVEANTTDRNGKAVTPAQDSIDGRVIDDPATPADESVPGGLDLVAGKITVEIAESGEIKGTTKDVAPNTDVVLTISGKNAAGVDVTVTKTVKTDGSGNYSSALTPADGIVDGSAVTVVANTTDRNGKPVAPATDAVAGKTDHDNNPGTPNQGGIDLVAGKITVDITDKGIITGGTTDVAPNTDVVLTISGKNAAGVDVTVTKTVKTDGSGNYSSALTPADGIVDGSAVTVVANTTDRNGKPVAPATDAVAGKTDHDNNPGTPNQGGIDLVAGKITVDITDKGIITGGTTDVAPNTDVVLTISGKNAAGVDVTVTKTVKTDGSGNYSSALTPADGIVDGSAVTVVANTTDRNGKPVAPATDAVAGKTDHDNNPGTPNQGGIDLVAGKITVDITDKGIITGGTTDVAPNTDVVLTISGKNAAGVDVTVTKTVKTDGSGNYSSALTPADGIVDGSAVTVVANTTDRNGKPVAPATDAVAGKTDHDNNPGTPNQGGIDLVAGKITVDITDKGIITGGTTDVAPNTDVVLTISGKNAAGGDVTVTKTVKTDGSGNYTSALTPADGIAEGSAVTVVASTTDRNGRAVPPATDAVAGKTDHDNNPGTPDQGGIDLVAGKITVDITDKGIITGGTTDVAPNTDVVLTISGKNAAGIDVTVTKTVKTDGSGNYSSALTPADGIVDGSAVTVVANTTDRNGKPVAPATDAVAGKTDHDNNPGTPNQGGIDLVAGKITVDITDKGIITGGTTDVAPNTDVVLTITGKNAAGGDVTVTKTVKTDGSGNYSSALTPADGIVDGSAVTVVANTTDRNGKPVAPATDAVAGKTDHDNNPGTPNQGGIDLVAGKITVDITDKGIITGGTTDVAPNTDVVLTISGKNAAGVDVTVTKTVKTDGSGSYSSALTPADGIVDGSAVTVVANTTDRNGKAVPPATDAVAGKADHDNNPGTPNQGGIDLVAGKITVDITDKGIITGGTTDVAPNTDVVLTISGKNAAGIDVTVTKTVKTDGSGNYSSALTPADGIADGSAVTVVANTTDRNGKPVAPATDAVAGKTDHDNNPGTPDQGGIDLVAGKITVDITDKGIITGGTTDVAPNTDVVLTISGKNAAGIDVTVTKTVKTDGSGNYSSALTPADGIVDGSAVTVVANTTDRNGKPVAPATDAVAGKTDHDNNPGTPNQGGIDLVAGKITVDITDKGIITGGTTDVAPNTDVVLTISGKNAAGVDVTVTKTVKTDGSGNYSSALTPADGIVDGSAVTVVANTTDRNGKPVAPATDAVAGKTDHDNNPGTPNQGGIDLVAGKITVDITDKGIITGGTTDVAPNTDVVLTISGKNAAGVDVTVTKTVKTDGSGNYSSALTPADGIVDGSAVTVVANTTDRNGKPVAPATDAVAGKTDHDNNPGTPNQGGIDLVAGKITVDITDKGIITGGTTDVAPNTDVVLTITGKNAAGGDVTVTKTVKTDGSGNYSSALTPADGIVDGSAVTVVANTTDRNGKPVAPATDAVAGKTDHDNNPGTPNQGGIDLVAGKITVDITDKGIITGGTTDVAPNTDVVLTISGKNAAGVDVTVTKTVKTDGSGSYSSALTPADGIAEGSAVTVVASTTDRNGRAVPPATDAVAGKADHDNNPGTPNQGGIDLVAGKITVDITDKGIITGGTTDVAPNTDVVLTISGKNAAGGDVTVTKTVKTDGSGNYTSALTPADGIAEGSAVTVVASTTDRNGRAVPPATDAVAGKTDHDNNPGTPDQGGIDLVAGKITVDITDKGIITGGTTDVAPNTDVVLTISGKNAAGIDVTVTKTVKTDGSGNYSSALTPADGIVDGSAVTVVANTTDRNGKPVAPATDAVAGKTDHDNNPGTPNQGGIDLVAGKITVDITDKGIITGGTTDVAPNTDVVLTITGKNAAGGDVTVTKTVKTDGSGNYSSALTPADGIVDGSAVTVVANTTDRNGKPVAPATDAVAGKTDHDNNPGTPNQGGIDLVAGKITVDITDKGIITGGTTDVAPNTDVVLTISGKNAAGVDVTVTKTVKTDGSGSYSSALTPADGIVDGSAVTVVANTTDRNGKAVPPATDAVAGKADHDNNPGTPNQGGIDLVAGKITVDITDKGIITGGTTDVAPNTDVVLTISGKNAAGIDVTVTKTVKTDGSGNYSSALTPADGIADGSAVTVVANTTDRNGKPVAPATDAVAGKTDHDNNPGTPDQGGIDLVAGKITVDITDKGIITGGTTDVAPNTDVVLTISGKNAAGIDVTVTKTVKTDGSGNYSSALTPADGIVDGSAVTVVANTTDRNGKPVAPATDAVAGKTDHDNNPGTPDQGGIDLVAGKITVDITDKGIITGGTTDVAPNTDVVLTISGKNAAGVDVTVTKTVKTDGSGNYSSALTPADGIVDGSAVTVVANTTDRNGKPVAPATDAVAGKTDHDNNPGTPNQGGIDLVAGKITVDITDKGIITGGTTDVAPNTDVVLTISGKNAAGVDVTVTKTVKTDGSGNYSSALTPADGIVDGSAVTVVANTTDRNGKPVAPATDAVAGKTDHDNNPGTPNQGGIDLVAGKITVDITDKGIITGGTTDVAPNTDVVLTITGKNAAGGDVTVTKTVKTDGSGNYSSALTPADGIVDGSAVTVVANTTDRNGKPVAPATDAVAGKTDHDNNPGTPNQGGIDLVAGKITVDITDKGIITGGTTDVAPNTDVVLTISGKNAAGVDVTVTKTVKTDGSGSYSSALTPADGIAEGSAVTVVASTTDRNGRAVPPATDAVAGKADHDNNPGTPNQGGIDLVAGKITVDITDKGIITGGTTDVAPNTDVVLTISGKNAAGIDVTVTKTVKTDGSGNYSSALTPADGIADGSAVTVVANTTDRNGKPVAPATDAVAGKTDHDNNPGTPDQGGIDLVAGKITVDITDKGIITGGTTDVAPNTDVVLTISGKNAAGIDVTVTKTVKTDGSGNYSSALTPADGIVDGSAVTVVANTTDRNGKPVAPATDAVAGKTDHDNNPGTPNQGGIDLVAGKITVDITDKGIITGGTTDVAPNTDVVLTISGKNAAGVDVTVTKTVKTDGSGNYSSALTPADGIVDGSAVTVVANTTDRNGKPVAPATDAVAGKTDHDNNPGTPNQGGIDLVAGKITVDITDKGIITGGTTDVAPNTDVVLTISGKNAAGVDVTVTKTVKTDGSGNYSSALTPADGIVDGSAVTVVANTTDRNGKPVAPATDAVAGKTDHDNNPGTPNQGGIDLVAGKITVDITDKGIITGGTTDVAPNTDVVLTISGKNAAGVDVTVTKTVKTDGSGNYSSALTPADGIVDGSAVTVVANTTDRNGKPVAPATDAVAGKTDHDNNPGTPNQGGIDLVAGKITVDITDKGIITGGTTDVAPNTDVVLTISGKNAAGVDVTVTKTVKTDGSGNYTSALTPADGIAEGSAVTVVASTTDRNGRAVPPATDAVAGKTDHDNNPGTPDQGGIDLVAGKITVDITDKGIITGGTTDVAPNTDVVLTISGKNAAGIDVTVTKTVKTDGSGNYSSALTPADGIVDGSAVTVVANTTDRNGKPVAPATDAVAGKTDHDNNPGTPNQGGIDLVAGKITVDITDKGIITGGTTDVAPNTDVVLTISGKNAAGIDVTVTKTVKTDGSGNYSSALTPADGIADGSAVTVVANTTDRNGKAVPPATDAVAGKADHDNNPGTPNQGGIDLVAGKITVDITDKGIITGGTTDVAPNTDVVLTISGKNAAGGDVTVTKTVKTDGSGNYTSALTPADGIAEGSAVTVVASTTDRNGRAVPPATDAVAGKTDHDNNPGTPNQGGLDLVAGKITVDINDTDSTKISGTTADVAPNSTVTLKITSIDGNGETLTFTKTVPTDANGDYSYTLSPTEGNAADVIATVNDRNGKQQQADDRLSPVVKADPGTNVNNGDNTVTGTSGNDIWAGDIGGLKTNFAVGHNYNISIILDISGSMNDLMTRWNTRLMAAQKALQVFVDQMAQHDGIINLRITTFATDAAAVIQDVVVSNGTVTAIKSTIGNLRASGDTQPESAFTDVDNWLNSKTNGYENQIYYLTDGTPTKTDLPSRDVTFANLAAKSKVFAVAVGVGPDVPLDWVERYDNTDANGNKINNWSPTNHGEAQKMDDVDKLISYLISGSENFIPADVGNDTVKGGAGDDILFGDAMNTNWITGLDPLQYPKYSGYSKLTAHLKATVTGGAEPTQQQVYDYVKANYKQFIAADAADPATKGGDDTIYGGSGDDIIIAGAGNDTVYGGSGNDVISTGRGDDTIMFDVLNAADATGGNGKDTWVDYEANDKIEFGTGFFDGLLSSDLSNAGKVGAFISVANDGLGNTVVKVDRDGAGGNHTMSDLLVLENKTGVTLQDLLNNNQIIIG